MTATGLCRPAAALSRAAACSAWRSSPCNSAICFLIFPTRAVASVVVAGGARLDRPGRAAELSGRTFIGAPLQVAEDQRRPILLWQAVEFLVEYRPQFASARCLRLPGASQCRRLRHRPLAYGPQLPTGP